MGAMFAASRIEFSYNDRLIGMLAGFNYLSRDQRGGKPRRGVIKSKNERTFL